VRVGALVRVGVLVGVFVRVLVGVRVKVGVRVTVAVRVRVGVRVGALVRVAAASGEACTRTAINATTSSTTKNKIARFIPHALSAVCRRRRAGTAGRPRVKIDWTRSASASRPCRQCVGHGVQNESSL
jgi:hypothetical protein